MLNTLIKAAREWAAYIKSCFTFTVVERWETYAMKLSFNLGNGQIVDRDVPHPLGQGDEYVYEGHIYKIMRLRYVDGGDVVAFCLDKGTPLNQTPPAEGDDVTGWRGGA